MMVEMTHIFDDVKNYESLFIHLKKPCVKMYITSQGIMEEASYGMTFL